MAKISYSKLLDPVSDIIALMESSLAGAFGASSGDQRECYKRVHAYCWGLHTLVMDVITALGIENAATRPAVLERFIALHDPIKRTLDNLRAGFDGPLDDEQHGVIVYVAESLQAIERMMTNLWQYSQIRHDKLVVAEDEFDGAVLIQRLRATMPGMASARPSAGFLVIGDETLLTRAFEEIAINARVHGGVERVKIATQDFGYRADITIYDRGAGFRLPEKLLPFAPFWQSQADNPGLGLGLHLAQEFIKRCGGKISLHSEPHRGALVKISLPTVP